MKLDNYYLTLIRWSEMPGLARPSFRYVWTQAENPLNYDRFCELSRGVLSSFHSTESTLNNNYPIS